MERRATKFTSPLQIFTPIGINQMTKKQIRDLQEFAAELAKEGNTAAAKEVLNLINKAG